MSLKQILKLFGSGLFLYGVFGYLFPEWGKTVFHANENLAHLLTALVLTIVAEAPKRWQVWTVLLLAAKYLATGLYGFAHIVPTDIVIKNWVIPAHLDSYDNYANVIIGLIFAWAWIFHRKNG